MFAGGDALCENSTIEGGESSDEEKSGGTDETNKGGATATQPLKKASPRARRGGPFSDILAPCKRNVLTEYGKIAGSDI